MRISRTLLDEVIAHARAEAPNECCGMIASRDGEAVAVHRARNAAASPLRYIMDPNEQYRIQDAIERDGLDLGVIYHSHTRSDPVPSQTDINLSTLPGTSQPSFPGTLYLIVGLAGDEPDLRMWDIVDGGYTQRELEIREG
jgi:[CysO sulfur-carrier protein]-S-L-cysteine hydrolase